MSVALLFTVDRLRAGARASFAATISDTDMIVGARGGGVQLLLYSVFRIGAAANNFTWETYQDVANHPSVDWIVPMSLGDSHRGFRVLGTNQDYFDRLKYRGGESLTFAEGERFDDLFDAVLGADVAAELGYVLGQEIVVAHGLGAAGFSKHDDKPFRVSGILAKTGTPVDRTVHVSLEAIEAIHIDWQSGARMPGPGVSAEAVRQMELTPKAATAALVGLKSRLAVFKFQRFINEYPEEPMTAVLPGVALQELWSVVGVAEAALTAISALVVAAALLGMATMLLAALNERRRELAILRANGARPVTILGLLTLEAAVIAAAGAVIGVAFHSFAMSFGRSWLESAYGLYIAPEGLTGLHALAVAGVALAGALCGLAPAIRAYRMSLSDGIGVRL